MTLIRSIPGNDPRAKRVPEGVPAADPLQVQAVDIFAAQIATGAVPSIRAIRSTLCLGQPRAQQLQAYRANIART